MRRTTKKPRLVLIAAGGTISMHRKVDDDDHLSKKRASSTFDASTGQSVPTWTAADLLAQTSLRHQWRVRPIDFVPPGGAYPDRVLALARRIRTAATPSIDGIVVSHGTDAMEEAAYGVDELVSAPVPIVFTGAMRPGWASGYDGIRNLENALRVASLISAAYGTLVTLNDQIFEAWSVSKADTGALDAFSARRGAPFGQIVGDQVECAWRPVARPRLGRIPRSVPTSVPILTMALAEDAALLDSLAAGQVQGLVIAGMATGTIPPRAYEKVLGLAKSGLPIVLCSGAASGWTAAEYYYPQAYDGLRATGVLIEDHLSARKTRLRLMLCLGLGVPYVPFGREFVIRAESSR